MKLTDASVSTLACPAGAKDALVFDDQLPGFGVRVTKRGGRTFLVQYRVAGTRRRLVLGTFGTLATEEARKRAKAALGKVAAGEDPFAQKRATAEAKRAERAAEAARKADEALTFGKLVESWLEARKGSRRPSYLDEAGRSLRRNFPQWAGRPASSITVAEAVRALDDIKRSSGPIAANRGLAYARAVFSWACRRQMLQNSPLRGLERPARESSRERVLTIAEVGAIWRAAGEIGEPYGPAIRLLLLTLTRREETAGMRRAELDNEAQPRTWTIPAARAKNGRAHIVHLADPARELLRSVSLREGSDFVFSGKSGGLTGWSNAVARLKAVLAARGENLEDWRLHDFRRAGVTYLASVGIAPHVADRLLAHQTGSLNSIAVVYQRHGFEAERRAALEAWAEAVLSSADRRVAASNVVSLRQG